MTHPACARRLLGAVAGLATVFSWLLLWPEPRASRSAAQDSDGAVVDDLEQNRQLLERYRREKPAYYARLRQDMRQFLTLPEARQAQLRQLDRAAQEDGPSTAYRLLEAAGRYVEWLEHLPAEERQRVEREADRGKRLALIREMREREWIRRLPAALQGQIEKAGEESRGALIAKLRAEERERRARWRVVMRHWDDIVRGNPMPKTLEELPIPVRNFAANTLIPMLSPEELRRLTEAEGLWPDYPRTLVELADKHPVQILGRPNGPRYYEQLPAEIKKALPASFVKKPPRAVLDAQGKWPDYLLAIADWAAKNKGKKGRDIVLPQNYCPSRPEHFSKQMQQFIERKLWRVLTRDEQKRLVEAEGRWPQYPLLVLELARKYKLDVPGTTLPGPRGWWDSYRTSASRAEDAGRGRPPSGAPPGL